MNKTPSNDPRNPMRRPHIRRPDLPHGSIDDRPEMRKPSLDPVSERESVSEHESTDKLEDATRAALLAQEHAARARSDAGRESDLFEKGFDEEDDGHEPSEPPQKKKKRGALSWLLLLLALACFAVGIYLIVKPKIIHKQQDDTSKKLLAEIDDDGDGAVITFKAGDMKVNGEAYENIRRPGSHMTHVDECQPIVEDDPEEIVYVYGIATIRIPSIDLEMPVAADSSAYSLRVAVGHYPDTPLPGEPGQTVIFGHRMYSYGRHFNRLDEVKVGDPIIIVRNGVTYTYEVTRNHLIVPAQLGDMMYRSFEDDRLMLVTCDPKNAPPGGAPHRLIVEAVLVKTE